MLNSSSKCNSNAENSRYGCCCCLLRKSLHSTILALNLLHESYYFYRVPHHIVVGKRNATKTTKKYTKNVNVYFALDCICTGKKNTIKIRINVRKVE